MYKLMFFKKEKVAINFTTNISKWYFAVTVNYISTDESELYLYQTVNLISCKPPQ